MIRPARPALVAAMLLLACGSAWPAPPPSTVGSITEHNGLRSNSWVIVETPSILRLQRSPPVSAQPARALAQYDRILELQAPPELRAEALRRAADLRVRLAEQADAPDAAELRRAVQAYEQLLVEQPQYPQADRVLYQLARARQLLGEEPAAIAALQRLGRDHPQSLRSGDAWFRAGELLYRRRDYAGAESAYRAVVAFGEQLPFFDLAQYKQGWSLFHLERHDAALDAFWALLDRRLPPGRWEDASAALAGLPQDRSALLFDSLRIAALATAALGGGPALNARLTRTPEPRFAVMLYEQLGQVLEAQQRYSDAAAAYHAFGERYPRHARAPDYLRLAIAAFRRGGFEAPALASQALYVRQYAPGAPYWQGQPPPEPVLALLRSDLTELARHAHANAQREPAPAARSAALATAADWYAQLIALQAQDPPARAQTRLLRADALLEAADRAAAAKEYELAAYEDSSVPVAAEAAYAAVQTWVQQLQAASGADIAPTRRAAIDAGLRLAERFPQHPQRALVLAGTAARLLDGGATEQAIEVARRAAQAPTPTVAWRLAMAVIGDAQRSLQRYADAETAYAALWRQLPAEDPERAAVGDELAASIHAQGLQARDAGALREAARHFLRLGAAVPAARIRAEAQYDAAAALMALQDWPAAQPVLDDFRQRYPRHRLRPDADKKLALAYHRDGKPALAAPLYAEIAERDSEPADLRREAAWTAATLYDVAGAPLAAASAFERYLARWPAPLLPAQQARRRLAELSTDPARQQHWLQALLDADREGDRGPDALRRMAAEAALELGQRAAAEARAVSLQHPLAASLARRKARTERALALLDRAAAYRVADVSTAATHALASVYRDLAAALLQSPRPRELDGEALAQYELLLEEQAFPFEEKAIHAHELNLQRVDQGLWDPWLLRSTEALAELVPGKYAKRDLRELNYDGLY